MLMCDIDLNDRQQCAIRIATLCFESQLQVRWTVYCSMDSLLTDLWYDTTFKYFLPCKR